MFRGYLVCYDIRDERRLRRVHKLMKGYGEAWQYSVFYCRLKDPDRIKMQGRLQAEMNEREDQVFILDLGTDDEAVRNGICCLGVRIPEGRRILVI